MTCPDITLAEALEKSMRGEFGKDRARIEHAMLVFGHAGELAGIEGGDSLTVIAAALLHDIGIHEAERKHNSAGGRYQEIEGPPIARKIMKELGMDADVIEHVCRIVGSHHTGKDIDTIEFRILWDADWLVNLPEVYPAATGDSMGVLIARTFRTVAGASRARELFMK